MVVCFPRPDFGTSLIILTIFDVAVPSAGMRIYEALHVTMRFFSLRNDSLWPFVFVFEQTLYRILEAKAGTMRHAMGNDWI